MVVLVLPETCIRCHYGHTFLSGDGGSFRTLRPYEAMRTFGIDSWRALPINQPPRHDPGDDIRSFIAFTNPQALDHDHPDPPTMV